MAALRKANSHSVVIYRLIKKVNNVKEEVRRFNEKNVLKIWFFLELPSAYEVLIRRKLCRAYHRTVITPKEVKIGNSDRTDDGQLPHKNSPLGFVAPLFKLQTPYLFAPPGPINITTMTRQHI